MSPLLAPWTVHVTMMMMQGALRLTEGAREDWKIAAWGAASNTAQACDGQGGAAGAGEPHQLLQRLRQLDGRQARHALLPPVGQEALQSNRGSKVLTKEAACPQARAAGMGRALTTNQSMRLRGC